MKRVQVLVPVYKRELDEIERFNLDHSIAALTGRDIALIGPQQLERGFYAEHYANLPFISFDDGYFASVQGYNRLLVNPAFYQRFADYEFVLILQTDAIVIRDDLDFWCRQPFDYVGAPWPDGVELFVNAGRFEGDYGKRVKVQVGNGGLSLRRVSKCLQLLQEFPAEVGVFVRTASSEDLFFAFMGALSCDFVIPNEITASLFSTELKPAYYFAVNGGRAPMGGHRWWLSDLTFWRPLLHSAPPLPDAA